MTDYDLIDTAIAHYHAGRIDDARADALRAYGRLPESYEQLIRLGNLLDAVGELHRAIEVFEEAIECDPDQAEAYNRLAVARQKTGPRSPRVLKEMLRLLDDALERDPDYAEAKVNRAVALHKLSRVEEARQVLASVTGPVTERKEFRNNYGIILQDLGRYDESIEHFQHAIEIDADGYFNWGTSLYHLCRYDEALALYRKALALDPHHARTHTVKGMIDLLHGRFEEGWAEYEWRKRTEEHSGARPVDREMDPDQLQGMRVLLLTEQGLGDTLHLVRYAALLRARGAHIIVECHDVLTEIVKTAGGVDEVYGRSEIHSGDVTIESDCQAEMMSLPYLLKTNTVADIPARIPYLHVPEDRRARWADRIESATPSGTRLKVGLVWAGSPTHQNDRQRSLRLTQLAPLFDIPGIIYFTLQKGSRAEAEALELPAGAPAVRLGHEFENMADTAGAIANLDLVVSVDTSVVHLAGAIGAPVWTLLTAAPDWRWLLGRDDTPWYPTMRLFRQPSTGDWDSVIATVVEALRVRAEISAL